MDINKLIVAYRKLRELKDSVKKRQSQEMAPIIERMEQVENLLHAQMSKLNVRSLKGEDGTAFLETAVSVTVEDFNEFLQWIREHEAWGFLEARASKTAVKEYVEDQKKVPPGIKYAEDDEVRVRK